MYRWYRTSMDFFKKIGKEVSVFGLVFVVFIALFAYRQVTHVELSTISQDKLEEKIKDTIIQTIISFIENYDYFVKELETDDYFYGLEDSKDE